jgi:hypothetical protein
MITRIGATLLAGVLFASLSGCHKAGPAEQAGEAVDDTVEKVGEQIEKAGDSIEDAAEANE